MLQVAKKLFTHLGKCSAQTAQYGVDSVDWCRLWAVCKIPGTLKAGQCGPPENTDTGVVDEIMETESDVHTAVCRKKGHHSGLEHCGTAQSINPGCSQSPGHRTPGNVPPEPVTPLDHVDIQTGICRKEGQHTGLDHYGTAQSRNSKPSQSPRCRIPGSSAAPDSPAMNTRSRKRAADQDSQESNTQQTPPKRLRPQPEPGNQSDSEPVDYNDDESQDIAGYSYHVFDGMDPEDYVPFTENPGFASEMLDVHDHCYPDTCDVDGHGQSTSAMQSSGIELGSSIDILLPVTVASIRLRSTATAGHTVYAEDPVSKQWLQVVYMPPDGSHAVTDFPASTVKSDSEDVNQMKPYESWSAQSMHKWHNAVTKRLAVLPKAATSPDNSQPTGKHDHQTFRFSCSHSQFYPLVVLFTV